MAENKAKKETTRVRFKLPRNRGQNANQDEFFYLNGQTYILKRGEEVEIPVELKEVIDNSAVAEEAAWVYAEEKKLREA